MAGVTNGSWRFFSRGLTQPQDPTQHCPPSSYKLISVGSQGSVLPNAHLTQWFSKQGLWFSGLWFSRGPWSCSLDLAEALVTNANSQVGPQTHPQNQKPVDVAHGASLPWIMKSHRGNKYTTDTSFRSGLLVLALCPLQRACGQQHLPACRWEGPNSLCFKLSSK